MNEQDPGPQPGTEQADDLGLTSDQWDDLRIAYNYGQIDPVPGSIEDMAFRQMDESIRRDYDRSYEQGKAASAWRTWAKANPQAAASQTPQEGMRWLEAWQQSARDAAPAEPDLDPEAEP